MLRKFFLLAIAGVTIYAVTPNIGIAQEAQSTKELLERIEGLEKKVDELNTKLSAYEKGPQVTEAKITKSVEEALAKKEQPFLKALEGVALSGYVDASYTYNFNRPNAGVTPARVFDSEPNSFNLQSGKIALEKLADPKGGAGFRTDLLFGNDAKVIKPFGWTTDDFDVEQAYVDIVAPLGKGIDFKVGKFATLHGAEVIESMNNWNFSRSLLFGYAIPFTHTGVRASYNFTDTFTGYLGVNNGWDDVKDNNKGKSVETAFAWTPKDWLSFNLAGLFGPEEMSNNHSNRSLVDFIATVKPLKKLTLKVNTDYAYEDDAVAPGKKASWNGVAGYAKYDFTDWLSLANRIEFFSDPKGLRVIAGTSQDLWEDTLTLEIRPYKNLITRLEYRFDESNKNVFPKQDDLIDHQGTFGFETIYSF